MLYDEAKKKVLYLRIIGLVIMPAALLFTVISLLKFLYFGLDNGDALSSIFTRPIKQLVFLIYNHTQFLFVFWKIAPTPDLKFIVKPENIAFLASYLSIFIGAAILGSANALARRLRIIEIQIEDAIIKASIAGGTTRTEKEIKGSVEIQRPSIFKQIHALYLAPLIVGLILAVVVKVLGLA